MFVIVDLYDDGDVKFVNLETGKLSIIDFHRSNRDMMLLAVREEGHNYQSGREQHYGQSEIHFITLDDKIEISKDWVRYEGYILLSIPVRQNTEQKQNIISFMSNWVKEQLGINVTK